MIWSLTLTAQRNNHDICLLRKKLIGMSQTLKVLTNILAGGLALTKKIGTTEPKDPRTPHRVPQKVNLHRTQEHKLEPISQVNPPVQP